MDLDLLIKKAFCKANVPERAGEAWPFIARHPHFTYINVGHENYELYQAALIDSTTNKTALFLEVTSAPNYPNFIVYEEAFEDLLKPALDYIYDNQVEFLSSGFACIKAPSTTRDD